MASQSPEALTSPANGLPSGATERKALVEERTALSKARLQLSYLINPSKAAQSPGRFRTRALLRTLHYVGTFLYWRLVRWAKYAIIGAAVTGLSSFALAGSLASGVGVVLAPTGLLASIAIGTCWAGGKWLWRRYTRKRGLADGGVDEARAHPRIATKEPELMPW